MSREKELLKLTRQALKTMEQDSGTEIAQINPFEISHIAIINNHDINTFSQSVYDKAKEMEKQGAVKVEIQYSTSFYSNPAGIVLMHSALLIGRK